MSNCECVCVSECVCVCGCGVVCFSQVRIFVQSQNGVARILILRLKQGDYSLCKLEQSTLPITILGLVYQSPPNRSLSFLWLLMHIPGVHNNVKEEGREGVRKGHIKDKIPVVVLLLLLVSMCFFFFVRDVAD